MGNANDASLVVCCVQREERAVLLLETLSTYRPVCVAADIASATDFRTHEHDKVAVVDLGDALCSVAGRAILEFRNAGFDVIGCTHGSDAWPVARRAEAFLGGAEALLDMDGANWRERLQEHVARYLCAQAISRRERSFLRDRMRELGIVGDGPKMLSLFASVMRVGQLCDVPVLIHGETGTGKELIARAIHSVDAKRRTKPFLPLNCAALNVGTAESELFGHRRGAFTGADRDRRGLLRAADGGVLFLDEVGELDLALQAKLLRVLQDGRVLAVGEDRETTFDARIIAATNRSLPDMVAKGTFRADLYHRLNVISFRLPSLRERREDLPALVAHFVCKHRVLADAADVEIADEFLEALSCLDLPGNIRQLENLVRRALLMRKGDGPLGLAHLPPETWAELAEHMSKEQEVDSVPPPRPDRETSLGADLLHLCETRKWQLPRLLKEVERHVLKAALEHRRGDMSQAGVVLGLKARTLYNKRRKYHLDT